MFDNPRKELERLQQELLAAEAPEETDDELDDLELADWDEGEREPLSKSYTDEDVDEILWETEKEPREEPPQEPERPEKKHFVGLKFAIALEMLAIAGLFFWWYLWIR